MKKMWKLAVIALVAFAFVACGVKGKAEGFAEDLAAAVKANDAAEIAKIEKEMAEYVKDLDEKEAAEFAEAYLKKCLELGLQEQ